MIGGKISFKGSSVANTSKSDLGGTGSMIHLCSSFPI
jgi:hypothetical protein